MLLLEDKFEGKGNEICRDCVFMLLLEDKSEEKGNEIYEYCAFMLLFADRFEGKGNQNYRFQVLGCLSKLSPKYFPKNVYLNIENIIVIRYNQRRNYIIINKRKRAAK